MTREGPVEAPGPATTADGVTSLESHGAAWETAVDATPGIDRACSSLDWVLSWHRAFAPQRPVVVWSHAAGLAAFARAPLGRSVGLVPLEASWGLACPFVGSEARGLVPAFYARLCRSDSVRPLAWVSGVPPQGPLWRALVGLAPAGMHLYRAGEVHRPVARIGDGLEGFLARRGASTRATLRRAWRRGFGNGGIVVETIRGTMDPGAAEALHERTLAIERRSWKGRAGTGVDQDPMRAFYRAMARRVGPRGTLRAVFLARDGVDLAYCLGLVRGDTFRGLQVSFDDQYRDESLGNLAQMAMIDALATEPHVQRYDLGTEREYKERWAEEHHTTVSLFVHG